MVANTEQLAIVYDIGATKVAYGVTDQEGLEAYDCFPTPTRNPDKLLKKIGGTLLELAEAYDATEVAIGFNGPTNNSDGRCMAGPLYTITCEELDIGAKLYDVAPALHERDIRVLGLGDVEAAAYGAHEYVTSEVAPDDAVMYLNLGTGFNGEVIKRGRSLRANGYVSEWGNSIFEPLPGQYATWGSLVAGEGIMQRHGKGQRCTEELYDDVSTDAVWEQMGEYLAAGIAVCMPITGADHIVIGGSVSLCHERFDEPLRRHLQNRLSVLSEDCGSRTTAPEIYYVPEEALHTIALRGGWYALQSRRQELAPIAPSVESGAEFTTPHLALPSEII